MYGDKTQDEEKQLNIVFMRTSQQGTRNVKTHNRTTQKKTKKVSNTDPTKKPGANSCILNISYLFHNSLLLLTFWYINHKKIKGKECIHVTSVNKD